MTHATQHQITLEVESDVYEVLKKKAGGSGKVSDLLSLLARLYTVPTRRGYTEMALDESRENDAIVWSEALINTPDETR